MSPRRCACVPPGVPAVAGETLSQDEHHEAKLAREQEGEPQ